MTQFKICREAYIYQLYVNRGRVVITGQGVHQVRCTNSGKVNNKSIKSKNHTIFSFCCQEVLQKVFVSCWSHFQLIPPFPDKLCKDSQVYAMCTLDLVLCLVCLLFGPLQILVSYSVSNESAGNLLKLLIELQTCLEWWDLVDRKLWSRAQLLPATKVSKTFSKQTLSEFYTNMMIMV